MKKFGLKIGIDVDDVTFECNKYAIKLANMYHRFDPPLTMNDITVWGPTGDEKRDSVLEYFTKPKFFETQPVMEGAVEFIEELQSLVGKDNVFFITAVQPGCWDIRYRRLKETFPTVPEKNIIIGSRKDLVKVDIMLDDGPHNILSSTSAYPVLFRRPWNQHLTGCLAVNNYEEFITLVKSILNSYVNKTAAEGKKIYCFYGPSASGKTSVLEELVRRKKMKKAVSYTSRPAREGETQESYHFVSKDKFLEMESKGFFFETTRYAGNCYGSSYEEVDACLKENNVGMVLDICGAIAMKRVYDSRCVLVYIKRDKRSLISSILERDTTNEDKLNRIISLSDELRNEELADIVIDNTGSIENSVSQFLTA